MTPVFKPLAEDCAVEELVPELTRRIILPRQRLKVRQFFVERLDQREPSIVNTFPQCGRASNGARDDSICGKRRFTSGNSGFQVK